jgi:putative ATPase
VYTLKPLGEQDLILMMNRALERDEHLRRRDIHVNEYAALFTVSGGDGRKMLNLLELITDAVPDPVEITDALVKEIAQKRIAQYDKTGEQHYDLISAFIKSVRGSDPNAALYYLARMIEGGEDVSFIARRMLILASEDIGNANPTALVMATSTFQAVNVIGYPESRILLSQCAVYLACSPKSNASYVAIDKALQSVREHGDQPVPLAIRNAPTGLMKDLGYGDGYRYAHDFTGNFAQMEFLPDTLRGTRFYEPGENPREAEFRKFLRTLWGDKYGY